jgi:hypothetical protein
MNCLVKRNGDIIKCNGGDHETICKLKLNQKLSDFLYSGGLRIMLHGEKLAVEHYGKLSRVQNLIVRKILKMNLIYELVTVTNVIKKFRPIRSYNG